MAASDVNQLVEKHLSLVQALLAVLLLVTARRLAALERAAADEGVPLPGRAAPQG